ncbi:Aste57867_3285 [Aphanomyces stellatus]|uniref:Aste57867_3285 protein n=1 Tax=Aphanomyces stellatus TaxID=120398 RepID=A0A485KEU9_9STRA|nr:hypothetical protein As57867_003275 [Aphanomyces stellatus]VFT80456.1 Aste57867_3285 [Aphanomyces stellatus]
MFLAAASGNAVTVYDVDGGTLREGRKITSSIETEATCVAWNHNNRILVNSFANGLISINTLASREPSVCNLQEGSHLGDKRVNSLHLSSGSRYLISGGMDRIVRVWDLKRQHLKHAFAECNAVVRSVAFTGQTDEYIVAGCDSGDIYLYHAQQGTAAGLCRDRDDPSAVLAVSASPHPFVRNTLGVVHSSGALRLWDVPTASLVAAFPRLHWAPATCIAFSPVHKNLVATAGLDKRIVFCDLSLGQEMNCLESPHPITSLSMHANGSLLATGTSTGTSSSLSMCITTTSEDAGQILLYDLRSAAKPLSILEVDTGGIQWLQFSQDKVKGDESTSSLGSASLKKAKSFQMHTLQTSLINLVPSDRSASMASPSRASSMAAPPPGPTAVASTAGESSGEENVGMPWLRQELQDMRQSLSDEIQMVHLEVLRQHQTQQTEFAAAMHGLRDQMAQLIQENQQLRRENERLKHIF